MLSKVKLLFLSMLMLSALPLSAREDELVFMYNDHEPYVVASGSEIQGFVADYVQQVAQDANIRIHWNNVPWQRQIPTLRRNTRNVCAITLFKTPEREAFVRFTAPVGSDGRFVLMGQKDNERLTLHTNLKDVIDDPALAPVLQVQTVYNDYIDGLLATKDHPRVNASVERVARSHLNDDRHYFIVAQVRVEAFLSKPGMRDKLAVYDHFEDMQAETYHYIGCTMATDAAVFERLNNAIKRRGLAAPTP